jgi:putative hemolysin
MDVLLLLLLILLNAVFAMSEMAVVSSRKARLQRMADDGFPGAKSAMALNEEPSAFLSTIQVGITTIGILSGVVGEGLLASSIAAWLSQSEWLAPYAKGFSVALVVVIITYLSVVIGELVPKRLALLAPERIASVVARPMVWLSGIARPMVMLLSSSSNLLLRLLGARRTDEPPVTDDEIKVLMEQGAEAGVFHESEQAIVSNVLRLDDQRVGAIMTPRMDIYAIDLEEGENEIRGKIAESPHSRVIVCRGGLEHILGVLKIGDLLKPVLRGDAFSVEPYLTPPLFVPETISTTQLLESFRKERVQFGLIVDEYGDLQGLVSLTDVAGRRLGRHRAVEAGARDRRSVGRGRARLPHRRRVRDAPPGPHPDGRGPLRGLGLSLRGRRHGPQPRRQAAGREAARPDAGRDRRALSVAGRVRPGGARAAARRAARSRAPRSPRAAPPRSARRGTPRRRPG